MSYVEIETGTYIKRFAFWNPATWSIPKLYWDAWSQEQRLHAICRQLEKVIKYADYLGVNVDDIAARLKAIEEGQLDDFIIAAIEAWFEEHEPDITLKITALEEALPISEFDSENTVKDAIDANTLAIGANADDIADLKTEVEKIEDEMNACINFKCIDRFISGDYESTGNSSAQAGCVFEQNSVLYWAQIIEDSTNTANDRLIIRNLSNGATASDTAMDLSHGYSLSYNAENKELFCMHYENQRFVFIDVSNVYAPVIDRTLDYSPLGLGNILTCWYENDLCILDWGNSQIYIIDETLQTLETYALAFDNSAVPQNLDYDSESGNFYIGCSFPNCIIEVNETTKEQTDVFPVQDFYGCIYMRELESAIRFGDSLYVTNFENVDGFLVVSLLETDLKHGTVTSDLLPYIQPSGNIGANIDYTNGTLIPKFGDTTFKLAGDAIKWAQSVGAYGMVFLNFLTDYPHIIHAIGAEIAISSANADGVIIHAVAVERGKLRITPSNLSIVPDYAYTSSIHGAIYLLDSECFIDGDIFAMSDSGSYQNPCEFLLAASTLNAMRVPSAYTVNLVTSVLYAYASATVTKQTNYRSTTILTN